MNGVKLLKRQHRALEDLFAMFERSVDRGEREAVFLCIADSYALHTTLEELHLYPAAARSQEDLALRAVEEHLGHKRLLGDLLDCDPEDARFTAKMKVLRGQIEHHVQREEAGLFPVVERALGRAGLELLGLRMQATLAELERGAKGVATAHDAVMAAR